MNEAMISAVGRNEYLTSLIKEYMLMTERWDRIEHSTGEDAVSCVPKEEYYMMEDLYDTLGNILTDDEIKDLHNEIDKRRNKIYE